MNAEDRLRQRLRDPGWSLPAWPDANARVRRAARRQRVTAASATALVTGVVAVAVLPFVLISPAARPLARGHVYNTPTRTAQPSPSPTPHESQAGRTPRPVPALGSVGFPVRIYPAAVRPRRSTGVLTLCPASAGLEAPGPATPAAANAVLRTLGRDFRRDLRVSDRSAWPVLARTIRLDRASLLGAPARSAVRYSGPLRVSPALPGGLRHAVLAGCGRQVVRATWVIVYGPAAKPTRESVLLFVTRRGHMLFYRAD